MASCSSAFSTFLKDPPSKTCSKKEFKQSRKQHDKLGRHLRRDEPGQLWASDSGARPDPDPGPGPGTRAYGKSLISGSADRMNCFYDAVAFKTKHETAFLLSKWELCRLFHEKERGREERRREREKEREEEQREGERVGRPRQR